MALSSSSGGGLGTGRRAVDTDDESGTEVRWSGGEPLLHHSGLLFREEEQEEEGSDGEDDDNRPTGKRIIGEAPDGPGIVELPDKPAAKAKKQQPTVPFIRLFSLADKVDYFLMFFGTLGAAAHGSGIPVFLLFFGKLMNGLGVENALTIESSTATVNKVRDLLLTPQTDLHGACWFQISSKLLFKFRISAVGS